MKIVLLNVRIYAIAQDIKCSFQSVFCMCMLLISYLGSVLVDSVQFKTLFGVFLCMCLLVGCVSVMKGAV